MIRLHAIVLGIAVCFAGLHARADVLSSNTEAAKLAHDKAQQWKSATAQKLEDLDKQLHGLEKDFVGELTRPKEETWCDADCLKEFDTLFDKDHPHFSKLPDAQAVTKAIEALQPKGNDPAPKALDEIKPPVPAQQKAILQGVCGTLPSPSDKFAEGCRSRLGKIESVRTKDVEVRAEIQKAQEEKKNADVVERYTQQAYESAKTTETNAADTPVSRLPARLAGVRRARCATAYCWGGDDGKKMAIEPILDLPVGMYWAAGGSALADYVNANNIKIQFNAGLRYWFAYDVMSVGILLAQPDLTGNSNTLSFRGKPLSNSQMRRPYPTLVIGFGADILQLSVSYDELRNASSNSPEFLPEFRPNQVLSRAVVFGIAISPLTAARNGIGASSAQAQEAKK